MENTGTSEIRPSHANILLPDTTLSPDKFPGWMDRFMYFTEHVRPLVNKDKLLIYTASGFDLAVMLGSGVREAIYVDPCYKSMIQDELSDQKGKKLGFDVLVDRVKIIDANPKVTRNVDRAAVMGTIRFRADGEERILNVVAQDAVGFNKNFSDDVGLYVSIGHGVPELFSKPVKADMYVPSTFTPRAWGYGDIKVEAGVHAKEGFPIAVSFVQQHLDQEQAKILMNVGSVRMLEELARRSKKGSEDDIRKLLALGFEARAIEGKSLEELVHLRFKRFWENTLPLPSHTKSRLYQDVTIYLDNLFVGVNPNLAKLLKQGIMSAAKSE